MNQEELARHYLDTVLNDFTKIKSQGDRSFQQLADEEFFRKPEDESNSIAYIVQHLAGNMRSRWTDFLTTDGEKPDRNRDTEFEDITRTRAELLDRWEKGWAIVFGAVKSLKEEDLMKIVTIRGEPHTVVQALQRQVRHYAGHVDQIVMLAKILKGKNWRTLSIPKKRNESLRGG